MEHLKMTENGLQQSTRWSSMENDSSKMISTKQHTHTFEMALEMIAYSFCVLKVQQNHHSSTYVFDWPSWNVGWPLMDPCCARWNLFYSKYGPGKIINDRNRLEVQSSTSNSIHIHVCLVCTRAMVYIFAAEFCFDCDTHTHMCSAHISQANEQI